MYTDAGGVYRHTLHTAQFNLQPGLQTAELRLWWQAISSGTCGGELAGDIVLLPVPPARVWIKWIVENVSLLKVACQSPSSSPSVGNSVALYTVHAPQICLEAQEIFFARDPGDLPHVMGAFVPKCWKFCPIVHRPFPAPPAPPPPHSHSTSTGEIFCPIYLAP